MVDAHSRRAARRWLIPVALTLIASVAAYFCFRRDLPYSSRTALRDAEYFELLSLKPNKVLPLNPGLPLGLFHNHQILGRTTITDPATRQRLAGALRSAARRSDGSVMTCFNPPPRHPRHKRRPGDGLRHLLRMLAVHIHRDGNALAYIPITRSPEPLFDAELEKSGRGIGPQVQLILHLDEPPDFARTRRPGRRSSGRSLMQGGRGHETK